jgi:hypothetical protein
VPAGSRRPQNEEVVAVATQADAELNGLDRPVLAENLGQILELGGGFEGKRSGVAGPVKGFRRQRFACLHGALFPFSAQRKYSRFGLDGQGLRLRREGRTCLLPAGGPDTIFCGNFYFLILYKVFRFPAHGISACCGVSGACRARGNQRIGGVFR